MFNILSKREKVTSDHTSPMNKDVRIKRIACFPIILSLLVIDLFYGCENRVSESIRSSLKIQNNTMAEGSASIIPNETTVRKSETFTIKITVGPSKIAVDGAIWIDDPDFDGMGWSISQNFQIESSRKPGYISGKIIGPGRKTLELKRIAPSSNQMRHYVIAKVKEEPLIAGDQIVVVYGDTSLSESGATKTPNRAYKNATFNIYIDSNGDDIFHPIKISPMIQIKSSMPSKIVITGTSYVQSNQSFETTVRLLDQFGNPAEDYSGTVSFTSTDPDAILPEPYTFIPSDKGAHIFQHNHLNTMGIQYIIVKDSTYSYEDESNPIAIVGAKQEFNLYWGDLHGHHGHHFYASGKLNNQYYNYAKDVSDLDFASESAKSSGYWNVEDTWREISESTYLYNIPGEFVTFLGFEWMNTTRGQGHHNIYYKDDYQPYYSPDNELTDTLSELWNVLSDKEAITIPHASVYTGFNWADQSNKFRTLAEIYSGWGSSEENRIKLFKEHCTLKDYIHSFAKWIYYKGKIGSVQQGLTEGNKMGFIASSDTHLGLPGGINKGLHAVEGLTAVYAKGLNRSDLWESFINRRTYGTTGVRILLKFEISGHMMGEEFKATTNPIIKVNVAGTSIIKKIDIIKCNYTTQKRCFLSYSETPDIKKATLYWNDKDFTEDSLYYVRVIQDDENMAWSSPIWVYR